MAQDNTSNRGFASMDEEQRREAARKGGKASHENRGNRDGQNSNESSESGSMPNENR